VGGAPHSGFRGKTHGDRIAHIRGNLRRLCGISDFAKVLDFGLVKDVTGSSDTRLTREDVVAGTPQYLAPETIRDGASSDPQSDLYALGAVAYYLLTATPVFTGRPIDVIQSHLNAPPEPRASAAPCRRSSKASSSPASRKTRVAAPRACRRSPIDWLPATT